MIKEKIILHPVGSELIVIIGNHEECHNYFKLVGQDNLPWCNGYAAKYGYRYYIYLNKDIYTPGTIAHEAIHVSWMLNNNAHLIRDGFTYNSQELQAYLVGYIVDEIQKIIDGNTKI